MNSLLGRSLAWSFVGRVANQTISLATFLILARILGPETVGAAIVPIFIIGFSTVCLQAIIGQTLISKDLADKPEREVILFVARRLPLGIVLILAFPIWVLFKSVGTQNLVLVFFLTLLSILFSQSHYYISLFEVKDDFKNIAKVEFISILLSGILAILIAVSGFQVLSLVFQAMALQALLFFFSQKFSKDLTVERHDKVTLKQLYSFAFPAMGASVVTYFSRNLDNLIVFKFIGKAEAGIYSRIYALSMFPVTQLSYVVSRVYFPRLTSLRNEIKEYRRIFFRGYYLISSIILSVSSLLILTSDLIIRVFLGVDWLSGSTILKTLMLSAMCQPVGATLSWLALSNGKSSLLFKWNVFTTVFTLALMTINSRNGLEALVEGYLIANLIFIVPSLIGMRHLLQMDMLPLLLKILRPYSLLFILWLSYVHLESHRYLVLSLLLISLGLAYFFYYIVEKAKRKKSNQRRHRVLFVSFSSEIWGAERSLLELGQGLALTENLVDFELICLNSELSTEWIKLGSRFKSSKCDSKFQAGTLILKKIVSFRYFSIVYFSLNSLILAPLIRLMKPSLQQILDFHDFLPRWLGRLKLKILSFSLNKVITISDFCLQALQGAHGHKTKLYRPIRVDFHKKIKVQSKRKRIGIIGRIDGDKNLIRALQVLETLPREFSMIFRGNSYFDKAFYSDFKSRAAKYSKRVQFDGKVEISSLYQNIDILFVTNANEPMGRTVGECQLLGIPVVVPNSGGSTELVRNLETGFTYNPDELDSISNSILNASRATSILLKQARSEAVIRHDFLAYAGKYRDVILS